MRGSFIDVTDDPEAAAIAEAFNIDNHPGYHGMFTRNVFPGALPNGTRVRKTWEDPGGDLTPTGTIGTVMGSIGHPGLEAFMYFVEWDNRPKFVIGVINTKVQAL